MSEQDNPVVLINLDKPRRDCWLDNCCNTLECSCGDCSFCNETFKYSNYAFL